jgi:succinate dehydrogenase / fumarate reductase membrane anchor subunit
MNNEKKSLKGSLARAKGLGSAKDGTHHWWMQRVTASALVILVIWLVISLLSLGDAGRVEIAYWLSSPINALLLAGFFTASFYHAALGLQVVIEDYIHCEGQKIFLLLFVKFLCFAGFVLAIMSIFKLHFMG